MSSLYDIHFLHFWNLLCPNGNTADSIYTLGDVHEVLDAGVWLLRNYAVSCVYPSNSTKAQAQRWRSRDGSSVASYSPFHSFLYQLLRLRHNNTLQRLLRLNVLL